MWGLVLSLLTKGWVSIAEIFAGPALTIVFKYWKWFLIGASVLLNFGLAYEWRHVAVELKAEKAAHTKDINDFKNAQAQADSAARAEAAKLKKEGQDAAAKADKDYTTLLSQYRASIVRYGASQSGSKAGGDSQLQSAQSTNGSSESSQFPTEVTISGDDASVCAENTARLQVAHDWALKLNGAN